RARQPVRRRRQPLQSARRRIPLRARAYRNAPVPGNHRAGAAGQKEADRGQHHRAPATVPAGRQRGGRRAGAEPRILRNTAAQAARGAAMRTQQYKTYAIIFLILVFAYRTFFTVKETEFALVTQFGRPLYAVNAAGLHVKWAFQSATYFDRRLRIYNP